MGFTEDSATLQADVICRRYVGILLNVRVMQSIRAAARISVLFALDRSEFLPRAFFCSPGGKPGEQFYLEVRIIQTPPAFSKGTEIASAGTYRVLPASCEIPSDFSTPMKALRSLKNVSTCCCMQETASDHETWGRYTFLGFDLKLEITCMAGEMKVGKYSGPDGSSHRFPPSDPGAL